LQFLKEGCKVGVATMELKHAPRGANTASVVMRGLLGVSN